VSHPGPGASARSPSPSSLSLLLPFSPSLIPSSPVPLLLHPSSLSPPPPNRPKANARCWPHGGPPCGVAPSRSPQEALLPGYRLLIHLHRHPPRKMCLVLRFSRRHCSKSRSRVF
jgi:hypothetical protein